MDTFTRGVASGWGVADSGGSWQVSGGASAFSVNGSAAEVVMAKGVNRSAMLSGTELTNTDLTLSTTFEQAATGGGSFLDVWARVVDARNSYRARVVWGANGSVRADLAAAKNHAPTVLSSRLVPGLEHRTGDTYRVRVQAMDSAPTRVRVKIWKAGSAEPADWALERTDDSPTLQSAGGVGLSSVRVQRGSRREPALNDRQPQRPGSEGT